MKCYYCDKNKAQWICIECGWGVCESCNEEEEYSEYCKGKCWDMFLMEVPNLYPKELLDAEEIKRFN